jgi:K+ transporter
MVIGYIDKQASVDYVKVKCDLGHKVNSTSSSFYLSGEKTVCTHITNFKRFYRDIKAIG